MCIRDSKYVFYSTCSFCCVICTLPHLGTLFLICLAFFFRISYFSGDIFVVVVLSYPVRQHLICLPWIFSVWFSSVQRSVTTEFSSLYDGESGRTLGVLLSFGRKNGLIRRRQQRHAQWITPRIVDGPHHPAGKWTSFLPTKAAGDFWIRGQDTRLTDIRKHEKKKEK